MLYTRLTPVNAYQLLANKMPKVVRAGESDDESPQVTNEQLHKQLNTLTRIVNGLVESLDELRDELREIHKAPAAVPKPKPKPSATGVTKTTPPRTEFANRVSFMDKNTQPLFELLKSGGDLVTWETVLGITQDMGDLNSRLKAIHRDREWMHKGNGISFELPAITKLLNEGKIAEGAASCAKFAWDQKYVDKDMQDFLKTLFSRSPSNHSDAPAKKDEEAVPKKSSKSSISSKGSSSKKADKLELSESEDEQ